MPGGDVARMVYYALEGEHTQHEDKTSWPELVGCNDMDAASKITHERPGVFVHFYDFDWAGPPPEGFDPNRVALYCDAQGRVTKTPVIG